MTSASTTTTQTRAGRPDYGLMELIHPVDAETFDRDYREKMPLVVKRADPAYYAHLLTLDDMDRILSTMSVPESTIRLVSQGNGIPLPSLAPSAVEDVQAELRRRLLKALHIDECRGQRLVSRKEMLQNLNA